MHNVWDERTLFVDDEWETGGEPKAGWGESFAQTIIGAGHALASRIHEYTDRYVLRLVVPSLLPANIKRNVDMSRVPTPSTPLHLPKPPPTPPAPPKKPLTPSPPKPKLRPPSSATLSTPAVPPPHRTFPIASDLVVDPPRKRRNQTLGKWQKTDGSKSGSRPRVSWKPRVRWGELSVRTLMKP